MTWRDSSMSKKKDSEAEGIIVCLPLFHTFIFNILITDNDMHIKYAICTLFIKLYQAVFSI
jgi:hypothetical protein